MHSVIFISIRNIESKRNIEQNKFTNCNNLFPNPILQNSRPTKILFHALPDCKVKSTLQLNSINTNDSTYKERNSKTLAQNKFNTRQPIQNLTGSLPPNSIFFPSDFALTDTFRSIRLFLFVSLVVSFQSSERTYI